MRISDRGLALIKQYEGFSATAYTCPAGYLTIGYGHIVKAGEPRQITEVQAEQFLRHDVTVAEQAVKRLILTNINQDQYDALVSFTFNLGAGALQRSTLRACVNRSDHTGAASQFGRWIYGGGRKLKGLIHRRNAEKSLYLTEPT